MNTTTESPSTAFDIARTEILSANIRPELEWDEIPSPDRIAPKSLALAAGVKQSGAPVDSFDSPTGAGRFILLNDPASAEEWGGEFRVVCYAQSPLELEIGLDEFIADVAWTWLIDALDRQGAEYDHIAGTATKTISQGYGSLEDRGSGAQLELRASWTPKPHHFAAHAEAWADLLCSLAGFPHQEGAASLDAHRASKFRRND